MLATWLSLCTSRTVVRRACYSALVVGPILIAINQGDALLNGQLDAPRLLKMALTLIVPYGVSTVSSAISTMESASTRRGG
jgi:hypothetical protein